MKKTAHRSVLKQQNKKFKGSSSAKKNSNGKVEKKKINAPAARSLSKAARKNQSKIAQKAKNEKFTDLKRLFQGADATPKIISVVPLGVDTDADSFIQRFSSDAKLEIDANTKGCFYSTQHKQRIQFLPCKRTMTLWQIFDLTIASDFVVLLLAGNQGCDLQDEWGKAVAKTLMLQGIPGATFCIQSVMDLQDEKYLAEMKAYALSEAKRLAPETGKVFFADFHKDMQEMSRQIFNNYPKTVSWKSNYPHIVVDQWEFLPEENATNQTSLIVTGHCRGKPLNIKNWVHIPMLGDFQVEALESESITLTRDSFGGEQPCQEAKETEFFIGKSASMELDSASMQPEEEMEQEISKVPTVVKVPKGTSSYQAAWYANEEGAALEADESAEEEYEEVSLSQNAELSARDEMEIEQEAEDLRQFKSEIREDGQETDEIEIPDGQLASSCLSEYRGVKSLKHSQWDKYEDLPEEYANIFHFQNFKLSHKTAMTEESSLDVQVGTRVSLKILGVSPEAFHGAYCAAGTPGPFVVFGLLRHENNPTVCHAAITRTTEYEHPISPNDDLILCVGFRKYQTKLLFSQYSAGEAHKMLRSFASDESTPVVASFYGQVAYPPVPVLVYDSACSLVASGSLLNPDPFRVVAERITLSGSPYKIFRKSAVIRFMFFDPLDVHYFKPIELVTKSGKVGRISDSLGTHGYMKCVFDKQLQQNDVVYMHLYKRVFPQNCTTYLSKQ